MAAEVLSIGCETDLGQVSGVLEGLGLMLTSVCQWIKGGSRTPLVGELIRRRKFAEMQ